MLDYVVYRAKNGAYGGLCSNLQEADLKDGTGRKFLPENKWIKGLSPYYDLWRYAECPSCILNTLLDEGLVNIL